MNDNVKDLLIATGNSHKAQEIRTMLGDGWNVTDLNQHPDLPSPEENGVTFTDNATIKALSASERLPGVMVLSDDSGLIVDALDGAPGVFSARYAGPDATDADNRAKLISALREQDPTGSRKPYTGRFHCSMVLALNGQVQGVFEGSVEGTVQLEETGAGGFGYDPLFIPEGHQESFGVLPAEVKNQLSHRARALSKVVAWLNQAQ